MKQFILIAQLFLFSLSIKAQISDSIFIGKKVSIYSTALNENRKVWIYAPTLTSREPAAEKNYPVLYLLDGDAHFLSTVGIIQQLSQANGNGILPEMIVVAIENTNRLKDLTPSVKTPGKPDKPNPFVNFLSDELIPFIDTNYNTSPYKLLVGHSLGGLTAIDILTNIPSLFNAYIAIEPSMWYSNETYLKNTIAQLPKENLKGKRLFIGVANTMPRGMTISKLKADTSVETQHIRSIMKLDKFLKSNSSGLKYAHRYYENDNHNSVPLISEYDGLRFIFDYFLFDATEKDFADTSAMIALKLKTHYDKVSKEMGYRVSAPETFINYFGYEALSKKNHRKAKALFQLNIEGYPNSSNTYNAYGDYFASQQDTTNAIVNYKKALQLKKDVAIENKVKAFTKQGSFNLSLNELKKYAGVYNLEAYKIDIVLEVRGSKLWAKVPGQSDDEFVPISKDVFTVKGKQGYTITFEMDGSKPVSFTSVQPNGTFKAVYKNE